MNKDPIWEAVAVAGVHGDGGETLPLPSDDHEHRTMRCRSCHLPRVFRRRGIRHSLHFMLALGTLGLWLPFWGLLILLQFIKPWTCSICGVHQRD